MSETMSAYCLQCRKKYELDAAAFTIITMKNGSKQAQAKCPDCGRRISRLLSGPSKGWKGENK
jgi:DNA-directed RNA polymerase subunit RPC12/RpoP